MTGTRKRPAASSEEWEKLDVKAQEIIVTKMEEGPLVHLLSCGTSNEMWEKLLSVYEKKSKVSYSSSATAKVLCNGEQRRKHFSVYFSTGRNKKPVKTDGRRHIESIFITKVLMSLPDKLKHFCIGLGIHGGWLSNIAGAHFETINRRGKDQFKWNGNSPGG